MTGVPPAALAAHPFLRGMPPAHCEMLAGAAREAEFGAGHRFFEEGGHARMFWLIRTGHVALDLEVPGRPALIVETLGAGDLMGVSWLSPPHEWQYGAEAVEPTATFELDGAAVLAMCEADNALGYQIYRRLMDVAARRLQSSRIRMLDLYAAPDPGGVR